MLRFLLVICLSAPSLYAQQGLGPGPGIGAFTNTPISYIGQCAATTTSCTPPAHAIGDLFIAAAGRDGNHGNVYHSAPDTTIDNRPTTR